MLMRMYSGGPRSTATKCSCIEEARANRPASIGDPADQRAERLWLAGDRGRRAPAGADQPVQFQRSAAHQFRQ